MASIHRSRAGLTRPWVVHWDSFIGTQVHTETNPKLQSWPTEFLWQWREFRGGNGTPRSSIEGDVVGAAIQMHGSRAEAAIRQDGKPNICLPFRRGWRARLFWQQRDPSAPESWQDFLQIRAEVHATCVG